MKNQKKKMVDAFIQFYQLPLFIYSQPDKVRTLNGKPLKIGEAFPLNYVQKLLRTYQTYRIIFAFRKIFF